MLSVADPFEPLDGHQPVRVHAAREELPPGDEAAQLVDHDGIGAKGKTRQDPRGRASQDPARVHTEAHAIHLPDAWLLAPCCFGDR